MPHAPALRRDTPLLTIVQQAPQIVLPSGVTVTATGVTVTRTFRRSLKLGEDFRTLDQETGIAVDIPAGADPIAVAVELGQMIDAAHTAAFAPVVEAWRAEARTLEESGPPSAKAARYLGSLMRDLTPLEQNAVYHVAGVNARNELTAGTCSALIDTIKDRRADIQARVAQVLAEQEAEQIASGEQGDADIPF